MTVVKICGITNFEDAEVAARFGADLLGFNFCGRSPRYIDAHDAREIIGRVSGVIRTAGVFVNEPLASLAEIVRVSGIDTVQLHGEEPPEYALEAKRLTGASVIKAFRVSDAFRPADVLAYDVDAILLDAYHPREHGGTGGQFDREIAKAVLTIFERTYLAGGLTAENIAGAVRAVRPFGVDACSGLESAKGKKDAALVEAFLRNAKNACL